VDNGQHVLPRLLHETLAFLQDVGGTRQTCGLEPQLRRHHDRPRGPSVAAGVSRFCPRRSKPAGRPVRVGDALTWEESAVGAAYGGPLRRARRALTPGCPPRSRRRRARRRGPGLIRNGKPRDFREMLWEPLALAAPQPAAPVRRAAPVFARVLAEMFRGPIPGSRPSFCRPRRSNLMYARTSARLRRTRRGSRANRGRPRR